MESLKNVNYFMTGIYDNFVFQYIEKKLDP